MTVPIYERLSAIYDLDWGEWPRKYAAVVHDLLQEVGISHARILDLACGTGTLALELAGLGHRVHGVDISPAMIAVAESKSAEQSSVSFSVADISRFEPEDVFDCVTCTFGSLNYLLDLDTVRATIERVGRALRPGGLFLFDCNTDRLFEAHHVGTHERELGGQPFLQKLQYDREQRIASTVFAFPDGTDELHRQHPYTLEELGPLLDQGDLVVVRTMSGLQGAAFTSESERLICLAQRVEQDRGRMGLASGAE